MKNPRKSRKPDPSTKLLLKEVIGLTQRNANGLASNPSTGRCAYVAGCVVVVYDANAYTQSHLMVSHRIPKPLACVAVSHDGRSIGTAEAGNQASVLVWDCASLKLICELQGHLHGVSCMDFSPDGKHLVAVGGYIYLWDWRSGRLATKIKASLSSSTISSVSFSPDAKSILTAGKKHFKTWSVRSSPRVHLKAGADSGGEFGKSINSNKERSFVSVSSVVGIHRTTSQLTTVYALSEEGILCLVRSGSIRKSVDLKVKKGFSVAASDRLVACGCGSGIVQLVHFETLQYTGTLSYNPNYNEAGVCGAKTSQKEFRMRDDLPDALACQFTTSERLAVLYSNHSLYIWDIHDSSKAVRCCVLVSHTAGIWNVETLCCESLHDASLACVARGCSSPMSFATCSSDGSVRLWDFDWQTDPLKNASSGHLLNKKSHSVSAGIFESNTAQPTVGSFRSLAISTDGEYLAAGDCTGNLHIFNLLSSDYTCLKDAHNSEVLSLSFSFSGMNSVSKVKNEHNYFLASGGRDRVIHLYDVNRDFERIVSVEDHSAAVTSVKLMNDGCKLLSCSADGYIIIRELASREGCVKILHSHRQTASSGTVYDMALDAKGQVVITVGQDRKINTFDIPTGKFLRSFKHGKDGGMSAKVSVDPSSSYLACSCGNCINIYDYENGELMITQAAGHGDAVTGVIFLPDCRHLISVGADGCVFVWKLPSAFTSRMTQNIEKTSCPLTTQSFALPEDKVEDGELRKDAAQMLHHTSERTSRGFYNVGNHQWTPTFNFTVSKLPRWAQEKIVSAGSSEAASLLRSHFQTPIRCDPTEGLPCLNALHATPDTVDGQSSILSKKRLSITSKRWLTVYTVCMDFPNSPHTSATKDDNIRVSNSFWNHSMMNDCCEQSGCDGVVREDLEIREKSHQFRSENGLHVGPLAFDRQQGELNSSIADHEQQETSKSNPSSCLTAVEEVHHEVAEISSKHLTDIRIQKKMNEQISLGRWPGRAHVVETDNSSITRSLSGESAEKKLIECCRALINLDIAMNSAAYLCSHIADTASGDLFSEPGSELRMNAALLLPSIYEKLNTIRRSFRL